MRIMSTLHIPAELAHLRLVTAIGTEIARSIYSGRDTRAADAFVAAVELALSEVTTNSIKHASPADDMERLDRADQIVIEFVINGAELSITVKDRNPCFGAYAESPPCRDIAEYPESGYGLRLTKQLMDSVAYRREDGWNMLTLKKLKTKEKTP